MSVFYRLFVLILSVSLAVELKAQEPEPAAAEESGEAEAPKPPVRPASALPRSKSPRDDRNHMQLLAAYLPEDGLVWVEHYPEPFLAYWQADRSGQPDGALLILHSEGASPVWQNTTLPLHESLPDHGWATFALALPEPGAKKIPARTFAVKTLPVTPKPTDEAAGEAGEVSEVGEGEVGEVEEATQAPVQPAEPPKKTADNTSNKVPVDQIIESRLESALRFLHDKGQFNIVIVGSGMNALHAQKFIDKITPKIQNPQLQGQLEKPIRAMVLLNSRTAAVDQKEKFTDWFSDPELPVLDIFFKNDPRNQLAAKQRKSIAKRRGVVSYTQVAMNEFSGERSWGENRLSRRIRSFIEKNASGVEVRGVLVD